MRASLIIPRLRANCPLLGGRVAGSAEFGAAAVADDVAVPCAFVIPLGDTVGDADVIGEAFQEIDQRFTVIVCVSNLADERGQAGSELMADIRDELIAALLGWSPSAAHGPIAYEGNDGDPAIDRARMWLGFDFKTATTVSA